MIAQIEPTAGKAKSPIYQLKVVLNETKPIIWRRLQVPGNANLGWLHAVLQLAMGWTNSHLHQFRVGELLYSDLRHNFAEFEGDPEIFDENKATLQQISVEGGGEERRRETLGIVELVVHAMLPRWFSNRPLHLPPQQTGGRAAGH